MARAPPGEGEGTGQGHSIPFSTLTEASGRNKERMTRIQTCWARAFTNTHTGRTGSKESIGARIIYAEPGDTERKPTQKCNVGRGERMKTIPCIS